MAKVTKGELPLAEEMTRERRARKPNDILLRKHGFKIVSRPIYNGETKGPNIWVRKGRQYLEPEALAYALASKKTDESQEQESPI